jgi:hypothetical protein
VSKRELVTVTKARDARIHADLWHASKCLLEKGQAEESGSEHQFKASLVFTAFTLEAYLNWLGQKVFPHWSCLERLAPIEKLDVISDLLKLGVDNARRPWQTTKKLCRFRNAMAHGKPVTIETETEEPVDEHFQEKSGRSFVPANVLSRLERTLKRFLGHFTLRLRLTTRPTRSTPGFGFTGRNFDFQRHHTSRPRPERAIVGHRSGKASVPDA